MTDDGGEERRGREILEDYDAMYTAAREPQEEEDGPADEMSHYCARLRCAAERDIGRMGRWKEGMP